MMALLSFILQIILQMVTKQKKTSAKRITGLANPTNRDVQKAYKLLVADMVTLKNHGYDVNKIARALYINLNPKKFAKNGIDWYEESQYELDRILGNTTNDKEIAYRKMTVNIRKQMDYIQLYFKFPTNNFFYQPCQKYYIVANKKDNSYFLELMLGDYTVKSVNYGDKNEVMSLLSRFFTSLPNNKGLKDFRINLVNKILIERLFDKGIEVNKLGSPRLAGLFWQKLGNNYRNIWKWNTWVAGIRGDRGRRDRSQKAVIGIVDRWHKVIKEEGLISGMWYKSINDLKTWDKLHGDKK